MKKKKRGKRKYFLKKLRSSLVQHKIELPSKFDGIQTCVENSSWFDIKETKTNTVTNKYKGNGFKVTKYIKCKQVRMLLTNEQKKIMNYWFDAYTKMYNKTLNFLRINYPFLRSTVAMKTLMNDNNNDKNYKNFICVRSKMYDIKLNIQKEFEIEGKKIPIHTLDYAIKRLCSNIKSAETNLYRKNIKRFRLRFWKFNRPSRTIDIEPSAINVNGNICYNVFGKIKLIYKQGRLHKTYKLTKGSTVKINYNSITNMYTLLVPLNKKVTIDRRIKNNIIILDPGLRTFMTGLSEDKAVKIGEGVNKIISNLLKRLDKIKNNKSVPNWIKKKNERRINKKINNMVKDLHWKTITYLTSNYKHILLGSMSAKGICAKNSSPLSPLTKVACMRTQYYQFRARLEYKCSATGTLFELIDERCTSKMCSNCGNYNDKLKGEKIYNCKKCKCSIDRDYNACKNIYYRSQVPAI